MATATGSGKKQEGPSPEPSEGEQPGDTLTSDFWSLDCERTNPCSSQATLSGAICCCHPGKAIRPVKPQ